MQFRIALIPLIAICILPIQPSIQVSGSNIARATVSLASSSYNNGLSIDDVEFSSEPATMAPVRYG